MLAAQGLALAACGRGTPPGETAAAAAPVEPGRTAQSVMPAKPSVDCSLTELIAIAEPDEAVASLGAIRPGMTWEEVEILLSCSDDFARVQNGGNFLALPATSGEPRQLLAASDGERCTPSEIPSPAERVRAGAVLGPCADAGRFRYPYKRVSDEFYVAFAGVPGAERARGLWRTQRFERDTAPTVEAARAAMIEQYGQPSTQRAAGENDEDIYLVWAKDPKGAAMDATHEDWRTCTTVNPDFEGRHVWSVACGLTVAALLETAGEEGQFVAVRHVGILDQARFYRDSQEMAEALRARQDGAAATPQRQRLN